VNDNNRTVEPFSDVLGEYVNNLEQYLLTQREKRFVDGNKFADAAWKAAVSLRHDYGSKGRNAMLSLLSHSDSGIRLSVASDVLDFAPASAARVLEAIEKAARPFEGTAAHYCLEEWKAGKKKFAGGAVTLEIGERYE